MSERACPSVGPRIGNEGRPVCSLPAGHEGNHASDYEATGWDETWHNSRPVTGPEVDVAWPGWLLNAISPAEVERLIREAKAEALRDAANNLLGYCHQSAHQEICLNQHRSDRTSAHIALDVATDWLRARADTIAATDTGSTP